MIKMHELIDKLLVSNFGEVIIEFFNGQDNDLIEIINPHNPIISKIPDKEIL